MFYFVDFYQEAVNNVTYFLFYRIMHAKLATLARMPDLQSKFLRSAGLMHFEKNQCIML